MLKVFSLLGPSQQSVLVALLEQQCYIFMYFIRVNGRCNVDCLGTGVTLDCVGCLQTKRATHRWLSGNKSLVFMYTQPCVHEAQDIGSISCSVGELHLQLCLESHGGASCIHNG